MSVPESSDSKFVAALSALGKEIRQNMSFPRHFLEELEVIHQICDFPAIFLSSHTGDTDIVDTCLLDGCPSLRVSPDHEVKGTTKEGYNGYVVFI